MTTYIAHHGIKGQKWGVRRYQNEDGTLTAAGQRRYERDVRRYEKRVKRYERGKKLYSEGHTIRGEGIKKGFAALGTIAAAGLAEAAITATGKNFVMKRGATTITASSATVGKKVAITMLAAGGAAAAIHFGRKQRALRAYYAGKPKMESSVKAPSK